MIFLDTLISNVTVVTMNEKLDVLFGAYLGIAGGKISYIGKAAPEDTPATIIDGTGMVAMPGLVNCHSHLSSVLLRTCTDELGAADALEQQLRLESRLDERCAKAAATLGLAECLRFGITSVSDLSCFPGATAQVLADGGMKGNVALASTRFISACEDFDWEKDDQTRILQEVKDKWHGFDGGRIRVDGGIHAEYTGNHQLWEGLAAYCAEEALGIQLHLAGTAGEVEDCLDRTGLSPAELLACHGMITSRTCAAGCAGLTQEDRTALGKHKASIVLTPLANARQGIPQADLTACVKAGINVALGTDGAAEAGTADLFAAMRQLAFAARAAAGKPDALPPAAVLMTATVCGAAAQGRTDTGMLKEGLDADIVLLDFTAPHLMPCHNVMGSLVNCAAGGDVAMTMVRGKVLYRSGNFPTLDINAAVKDIMEYAIPHLTSQE